MAMAELVNVMEAVVKTTVDEVLKAENICSCDRCKLDVMAIALNKLPPKYVVGSQGKAYELSRAQGMPQNRISVYQAVLEAAHFVRDHPRHEDTYKFK